MTRAHRASTAPTITSPSPPIPRALTDRCRKAPRGRVRKERCMRLLLADDNEMNLDLFTAALDQHEVVVERDGAAALQRALSESFELILLDMQMPRMRGDEV